MLSSGDVARRFYEAVKKRDLGAARTFLSDDLLFVGLFETYRGPSEYLKALERLLGITTRLDVEAVIAEGDQAAVFFELETVAPAAATTFVAEWMRVANGRIQRVRSAFDGRPFAAMFGA
jgi:ketosteroid isomerase-like protein